MAKRKIGVNWEMTDFFPEFNGPEMVEFEKELADGIKGLLEDAGKADILSANTLDTWENIILRFEGLDTKYDHIYSYIYCLGAADTKNTDYSQELGKLTKLAAEFDKVDVEFLRAFKNVDDATFQRFINREKLQPIGYQIRRKRERAQKTMSRDQEMLAADLNVDGFHTWGRLYDTISGKLEFDMVTPKGKKTRKPISEWRSLMADSDREVGRAAFVGGNKAWEGIEDTCAAILNAISGTRLTLYKYRGVDHYLEMALFQAAISRKTLDAMYQAIYENLDLAREIIRVKANFMGRKGIAWYEREAPLPLDVKSKYTWNKGYKMVQDAYSKTYPKYGKYFKKLIKNNWVESELRPGKRPGAFCWSISLKNLERIYMTFNQSLSDITTLAHESGHAFHGFLMHDIRPMARNYPMTLAETASTFGEQILAQSILADESVSDIEKLLMMDTSISDAAVYLLDITVRFQFEKAFHDERQNGEVSVSRLKELMVKMQKEVMGDILLEGGEDPLFWASKLHFYKTGVTFYNYPYTFGYLFSKAIFNMFKKEGESFLPKYEELLRQTGSGTVEEISSKVLGVNTEDPKFWSETIQSLRESLDEYKRMLGKVKS
jgi:oligoendopeptidase F